jgi:hypothetical protein
MLRAVQTGTAEAIPQSRRLRGAVYFLRGETTTRPAN